MWQSMSKNGKIILLSVVLLIVILIVSSWDKAPELIDQKKAYALLESHKVQKLLVKEPYVYLELEDGHYKIPKDAIEKEKLFSSGVVEYEEDSSELMDNVVFFVLLLTMLYIFYILRNSKRHKRSCFTINSQR